MNNIHVADDGYAVWTIPVNGGNNDAPIDVHINQWVMREKNNIRVYVDFGIRVYSAKNVSEICFYLPCDIEMQDIRDLSLLLKDANIARGVFNTNCSIRNNDINGIVELKYNTHDSNIFELPKNIKKLNNGIIITFDVLTISKKLTKDELYIRFRIPNKKEEEFLAEKSNALDSFARILSSPILHEKYLYTIRVNEMRSLPEQIRFNTLVQNQKILKIILTVCANGPFTVDPSTCYKTRVIEKELYKDYVPKSFDLDRCMVNQWMQEKASFNHYNFTCIFCKEEVNKRSLLLYAFFVICLSALGGALVELVKILLNNFFSI